MGLLYYIRKPLIIRQLAVGICFGTEIAILLLAMKNMTILKCNTNRCAQVPLFPVGALVRGILDNDNVGNTLGRWSAIQAPVEASAKPSLDFFETPDSYTVVLEVPGYTKEDIKISFHDGQLSVGGKRSQKDSSIPAEEQNRKYYIAQRSTGEFSQILEIPSVVKASDITANYKDGLLTITLPKAAEAKPHTITVSVG